MKKLNPPPRAQAWSLARDLKSCMSRMAQPRNKSIKSIKYKTVMGGGAQGCFTGTMECSPKSTPSSRKHIVSTFSSCTSWGAAAFWPMEVAVHPLEAWVLVLVMPRSPGSTFSFDLQMHRNQGSWGQDERGLWGGEYGRPAPTRPQPQPPPPPASSSGTVNQARA